MVRHLGAFGVEVVGPRTFPGWDMFGSTGELRRCDQLQSLVCLEHAWHMALVWHDKDHGRMPRLSRDVPRRPSKRPSSLTCAAPRSTKGYIDRCYLRGWLSNMTMTARVERPVTSWKSGQMRRNDR
jgi:hypothetical protein